MSNDTLKLKIFMIGDRFVGSSAFIRQFDSGVFIGDYTMPLMDFYNKIIFVDDQKIEIEVHDKCDEALLIQLFIPKFDGYILIYSVDNRESFNKIQNFVNMIMEKRTAGGTYPIIIIGNKCDLDDSQRQVSKDEGIELANQLHIDFLEVSSKTNENVQEAFIKLGKQLIGKNQKQRSNNINKNERCRI